MVMRRNESRGSDVPREREFKVILEDIHSQFRVFGEGMQTLQKGMDGLTVRMDRVEFRLDRVEQDVSFIKNVILPTVATKDDVLSLERRMDSRFVALEHSR